MENINRKILVIGALFLFLGASATLGVSASYTNGQMPSITQQNIAAINKDVAQTGVMANTIISANEGNDYHPRCVTNTHGQTVVVYEAELDLFTKTVPVAYSADDGITWTTQFDFNSLDFTSGSGVLGYPDIIFNPANDVFFLQMIDPNAEMYNDEMSFIPGDIAAATEASWYGISGSGSAGYTYGATACTANFMVSITGEDSSGFEQILGGGYFTYPDFEHPPVMGGFYYDGQSVLASAPVSEIEMDSNTNRILIVLESGLEAGQTIAIKSTVNNEALLTNGEQQNGMDKYADIEQYPGEFLGLGTDPDVAGSGNKVCVVFVQGGDVICKYSTCAADYEPGFSWQTSTVESGASSPAVYMQGNNVYCAYVKGGNLYLKTSADSGATWSAAVQKNDVNGKVIGEKSSVDICSTGIAFTDNRNGNYDIFFAGAASAPAPQIEIESISGGMGISAVVKNTGDAAGTDIAWSIKSAGTVFVGKEKSGTISSLAPGASVTIKTGFMLGFGSIAITVTADTAVKTANGKLLLFFVTGL
jgi:hypothetical protein